MLLLVFLMMVLGLFALLLGGGLVAQGYLYEQPAERMPLRAVGGAVLVGGFVTLWVGIDRRAPEKYDVLFNFRGETTVEFKRPPGEKDAPFLEGGTGAPFELRGSTNSGGQYMTGAIRVRAAGDAEPVRYNAKLNGDRTYLKGDDGVQFKEEKGSRYVKDRELGALHVPSTVTVVVALLLNFTLVVVWVVALWPVMRFPFGTALMAGAGLAVITMLALMPVLFKPNRGPKPPAAPKAASALVYFGDRGQPS
jgi:hypothetical protein